VGEPTSSHDDEIKKKNVIKNPRNIAINGMRMKEARKEAAVKWRNEHSNVPALTTSQVQEEVDKIITSVNIGGLGTLSTLVNPQDS
jgi:hypothetical protein